MKQEIYDDKLCIQTVSYDVFLQGLVYIFFVMPAHESFNYIYLMLITKKAPCKVQYHTRSFSMHLFCSTLLTSWGKSSSLYHHVHIRVSYL